MTTDLAKLGGYLSASPLATEFDALMHQAVAELRKLRDDVAVLRCYARHDHGCWGQHANMRLDCTCGLTDVLRAVDSQPPKPRERTAEWWGC